MINREKLNRIVDALEQIDDKLDGYFTVYKNGSIYMTVDPKSFGDVLTEDLRHRTLAMLTPIVGKMEKTELYNGNIGYRGASEAIIVTLNHAEACKIIGYKVVSKRKPKLVEVPGEFEETKERVAITDCDIKQGRTKEEELEVPA